MNKRLFLGVFLIGASSMALGAPGTLRCGRLLDVASGRTITDAVIVYDGHTITVVGPAASTSVPDGTLPLELPTATCLPGLIDVHTQLLDEPTDNGYEGLGISVPRAAVTGAKNARITLLAGFTTVRNVNAPGFGDVAVRDGIQAGDIIGPRMLVSGPALGITGGHADNNLLPWEFRWKETGIANGPWEVRARVRENVKYGADVIKLMASGGVLSKGGRPGTPQYTFEELQAIVEEAHKLGRRVAATVDVKSLENMRFVMKAGTVFRDDFHSAATADPFHPSSDAGPTNSHALANEVLTAELATWELEKRKDKNGYAALMSPGYIAITDRGMMDTALNLREIDDLNILDYAATDVTVRNIGQDVALLTYNVGWKGSYDGKQLSEDNGMPCNWHH